MSYVVDRGEPLFIKELTKYAKDNNITDVMELYENDELDDIVEGFSDLAFEFWNIMVHSDVIDVCKQVNKNL